MEIKAWSSHYMETFFCCTSQLPLPYIFSSLKTDLYLVFQSWRTVDVWVCNTEQKMGLKGDMHFLISVHSGVSSVIKSQIFNYIYIFILKLNLKNYLPCLLWIWCMFLSCHQNILASSQCFSLSKYCWLKKKRKEVALNLLTLAIISGVSKEKILFCISV